MRSFSNTVREARLAKHLTLEQVASRIGTHKGYISSIENRRVNPPAAGLTMKLAKVLGLDPRELLKRGFVEKAPAAIRKELAEAVFPGESE